MAPVESLPPDQRAVLELVLRRGRTYDEIAQLLSIDRADVRQRALSALDALGPDAGVAAERRALITDYLLGALPPRVTEQVRDRLAASPAERAWARVIAAELGPIASKPLPDIPSGGRAAGPSVATPPTAAPAEPAAAPQPRQKRERTRTRGRAQRRRGREPAAVGAEERGRRRGRRRAPGKLGPRPPIEPGAQRPPSRRGGRVVLTAAVIIVLAVVLSVVFSSGSSKKTGTTAAHSSSTSTTGTSATSTGTTTGTTTGSSQILAQINLLPPSGGKAKGIAEVLRQSGKEGLAIVATGLTANTSHNAYAVWLYNSPSDSHLLGFVSPAVGSNGRLQTAGSLPTNASHFHKLLVTLETKASPTAPGQIVLEGTLSGV
jgi:hypothetical protein